MKSNAIRIHEYGGPEVLTWEEVDVPVSAEGQAQIRHTAIGLNFIDIYHRTGLYPTELPAGLGSEAAGVIEAVGADVTDFATGDRVVDTGGPNDAYSELRNFNASEIIPIPDFLTDEIAAAVLSQSVSLFTQQELTLKTRDCRFPNLARCERARASIQYPCSRLMAPRCPIDATAGRIGCAHQYQ